MNRLLSLLTSSHFAAWVSGGLFVLAVANSARCQWDGVVWCGTMSVVTLVLMRHFLRLEAAHG